MPRPKRYNISGGWYHVFNRGICRKTIFFSDYHYNLFLEKLNKTCQIFGLEIHAFCLMKNHYHLLVHTPLGNLSKAMQFLLSRFAQKINEDLNADGSLFKDRFKSILIDEDQYLLQVSRYIHLNPVEACIVKRPEFYKWSSINYYKNRKANKINIKTEKILSYFKNKEEYFEYLNFGIDKKIKEFYGKARISPILSSKKLSTSNSR